MTASTRSALAKPNFFIVGAPKSGTTAMAEYLNQHPDVFIPEAKDSHFFGSDLHFVNNITHPPDLFRVNEKIYLSWFAGRQEKRLGEASVLYLYSKKAASEIKAFNADAKIIIMLRNPVDMLYSMHGHFLSDLNEDIEDFEQALAAETDRKEGRRIPETTFSVDGLFYREIAKYAKQVQRYLDIFSHEKVHIILFDDFKSSTADVYAQTLGFLDVSQQFVADFQVINPAKRLRSRKLQRLFVDPPGILAPIGQGISRNLWIRKWVKKILFLVNVTPEKRPPMDSDLKTRLQEEFADDVTELGFMIGRDLGFWIQR